MSVVHIPPACTSKRSQTALGVSCGSHGWEAQPSVLKAQISFAHTTPLYCVSKVMLPPPNKILDRHLPTYRRTSLFKISKDLKIVYLLKKNSKTSFYCTAWCKFTINRSHKLFCRYKYFFSKYMYKAHFLFLKKVYFFLIKCCTLLKKNLS